MKMVLILPVLLTSLMSQATATQCRSFYDQRPLIPGRPAELTPFQFAHKVLSALNQVRGTHAPYEFYNFVRDSLKRKHQVKSDLDLEQYQKDIAAETAETDAIGENYLRVQQHAQRMIEKIKEFQMSELNQNSQSPKQVEKRYADLVVINNAFSAMKSNLDKIKKDQNTLLNQHVILGRFHDEVLHWEQYQARYAEEFSEVYGHMIMEQGGYPAAANHLARIGNHFSIEIQGARAQAEKLRGLKRSIEIPLEINNAISALIRDKSSSDLESFFVDFGFTPEIARSLLADYEIKKQELEKVNAIKASRKAESSARWARWKKGIAVATLSLGSIGGVFTGYEVVANSSIEKAFTKSNVFAYQTTTGTFERLRNQYYNHQNVPGDLKTIIRHPELVALYLEAWPKNLPMTPEMKIFLLLNGPLILGELKFTNFLPDSLAMISRILDAPQTRNFTVNERYTLSEAFGDLLKTYESFGLFVDNQTGNFKNGDLIEIKSASERFFKDRKVKLAITPFQINWESKAQLEAWVDSNANPRLKQIFENNDPAVLKRLLESYLVVDSERGPVTNIEFLYILKRLNAVPGGTEQAVRYLNSEAEIDQYLSKSLQGKADTRVNYLYNMLRVKSRTFEGDVLELAPLTPIEISLVESYIAENSKTWMPEASSEYRKNMLSFFRTMLVKKIDSSKILSQR